LTGLATTPSRAMEAMEHAVRLNVNRLQKPAWRLRCDTLRTGRHHTQIGPFDGPLEVVQIEQVDPDYQKVNSSGPFRKGLMGSHLTPARFDVTCRTPKKACSTFDNHQRRVSPSQTRSSRKSLAGPAFFLAKNPDSNRSRGAPPMAPYALAEGTSRYHS